MKKITEFKARRVHPIYVRDANGNQVVRNEETIVTRPVISIKDGPRFVHFIVDIIVFQGLLLTIQYILELISTFVTFSETISITIAFIGAIITLLLYPLMYAICEQLWQKTPGKFLTKTVVIDEYANKPDFGTLLLRSFARLVPFEPFSCWGDTYSRGWHDKWSNTWVVKEEERDELKKLLKDFNEQNR
jgi:uncharacterized RDD family membrane protein YckC